MSAKFKINPFTLLSGTTATTINIPINISYQLADNAELIEKDFVDVEVAKSINPILDYEKVRYIPVDKNGVDLLSVVYNLFFLTNGSILNPTMYSDIGMTDDDLKYETNGFKESYVLLNFFDSDNAMTQNLIAQTEIYSMLTKDDHYQTGSKNNGVYIIAGQPMPANQVPVHFVLSNPLLVPKAFYEGYHIYDYKDDVAIGVPKYLYMQATYFNIKTGKITNLMTEPTSYSIDKLVNKLYTKYKLYRDATSFYYAVDDTYSKNVVYTQNQNNNSVSINLYQIQAS